MCDSFVFHFSYALVFLSSTVFLHSNALIPGSCSSKQLLTVSDVYSQFICDKTGNLSSSNKTLLKISEWIHHHQVCDGVQQCDSGSDEFCIIPGITKSKFSRHFRSVADSEMQVVILNWPQYGCRTPICYDKSAPNDLIAHIFCQQLEFATFASYSALNSPGYRAIPGLSMQCKGHERGIHACVKTPLNLQDDCESFLVVSCRPVCIHHIVLNGNDFLTNPGYPLSILPELKCEWIFESTSPGGFMVEVIEMNLVPPVKQTFESSEFDWSKLKNPYYETATCLNSHISMQLGWVHNYTDGTENLKTYTVCESSSVGKNISSTGPKLAITYFSGTYSGSIPQPRGFKLNISYTAPEDTPDYYQPIVPIRRFRVPLYGKILIFVFGIIGLLLIFCTCSWLKNKYSNKRNNSLIQRMMKGITVTPRGLVQLDEPEEIPCDPIHTNNPNDQWNRANDIDSETQLASTPIDKLHPLYCPSCDVAAYREGDRGCIHTRRMLRYLPNDYFSKDEFAIKHLGTPAEQRYLRPPPTAPLPPIPRYLSPINVVHNWLHAATPKNMEDSGSYADPNNNSSRIRKNHESPLDPVTGEPLYTHLMSPSAVDFDGPIFNLGSCSTVDQPCDLSPENTSSCENRCWATIIGTSRSIHTRSASTIQSYLRHVPDECVRDRAKSISAFTGLKPLIPPPIQHVSSGPMIFCESRQCLDLDSRHPPRRTLSTPLILVTEASTPHRI